MKRILIKLLYSASTVNRTRGLKIFSLALSQLSYRSDLSYFSKSNYTIINLYIIILFINISSNPTYNQTYHTYITSIYSQITTSFNSNYDYLFHYSLLYTHIYTYIYIYIYIYILFKVILLLHKRDTLIV